MRKGERRRNTWIRDKREREPESGTSKRGRAGETNESRKEVGMDVGDR